jgi:hypothetical protein
MRKVKTTMARYVLSIGIALAATILVFASTLTSAQSQPNTFCTGVITGGTYRNIVVPSGATCKLSGVHATGSVKVEPGGALQLHVGQTSGNTIDGNVQAEGARWITSGWQPGNTIGGSIQITGTTSIPFNDPASDQAAGASYICRTVVGDSVQIEDGAPQATFNVGAFGIPDPVAACTAVNQIGGSIRVDTNAGEMWVGNNQIGWNLLARENAFIHVFNNSSVGSLRCESNTSIDGGGNTAASKKGQCLEF